MNYDEFDESGKIDNEILEMLKTKPMRTAELATFISYASPKAISDRLQGLKREGRVTRKRIGRMVYYGIPQGERE